jgi:hypothetical protein
MKAIDHVPAGPPERRGINIFRRGAWENAATAIIAAGVVMLMQPFSLTLYGWSFVTTLIGIATFKIASKMQE